MRSFLFDEESGQGMVEYGLILALIAVACIVGFKALGTSTSNKADEISKKLDGVKVGDLHDTGATK